MPFIILLVGAIIVITAYRGTHGQLGSALQQDIPGFLKWGMAIAAILALGFVPQMKTVSRWLLALVAIVILVTNYKTILAGITQFAGTGSQVVGQGTVAPDPTLAGATGAISTASLTGSAPQVDTAHNAPPAPPNPFDPNTFVGSYLASTQGFGQGAA